ncbi:hypothetical protein GCK72_005050 [Caenorhabditis remanei]|uniref:Uncharacterized protein n=1 Tax=Caenorhabditis remanei TaxID=31234 RepID=A0A6A5HBD3_CAERE|nr:hypothetical protein GCK72_005050 [Caenorhabditis remanei]KAF1765098.1 hypothetical protein GCK72_005050 [Caenorhabditis remanei]
MANNILVSIIWQLFWCSILFPIIHFGISLVREVTPKIGHDERLFPRDILYNTDLLNKHRVKIADELYRGFKKIKPSPASVEVRVVASNRGNDFLYQTVIFLLEQQASSYPSFNYTMQICNVESETFSDLKRFDKMEIPISTLGDQSKNAKFLNSTLKKENDDYWKCMALTTDSRYILLIEDDAVVIPEFSNLLKSLVRKLDDHEYVDFVKLYHPNYLRKLPSYALMGAVSISLSFFSCYAIKSFFKTFPILTFLILSLVVFYDFTTYGCRLSADFRYYLTGSAYFSYPESCCTPAVIFRKSSVKTMYEYFSRSVAFEGHAKDHILDESPFTGRQSDVNYVTHIGSFSSIRQRAVFLSDLRDN